MGEHSSIAWTHSTWNPWRGCEKVSPGCDHCYITTTLPFRITGQRHGDPLVRASEAVWYEPFKWSRAPWVCEQCGSFCVTPNACPQCFGNGEDKFTRRRVFSLSLGDWLHRKAPLSWFLRYVDTIRQCPDLRFLLLTKRPEQFPERLNEAIKLAANARQPELEQWLRNWLDRDRPPHIVMVGTSVENDSVRDQRLAGLLAIPARWRFLSCEPLIGPLRLPHLGGIDWVIVGGESGRSARGCNVDWIRKLRDDVQHRKVPVFIKQLGTFPYVEAKPYTDDREHIEWTMKHPKGGDPDEWPEDLRIHQAPDLSA